MKTNYKIYLILSALVLAAVLTHSMAQAADISRALSTLPQSEEWSIIAFASSGQNVGQNYLRNALNSSVATDYEKRILAITAQRQNPATFGNENFLAKLESFFDGTQIGDPQLLNDDIFGLLALKSAGQNNAMTNSIRAFILNHQNADGGWGFSTASSSDSNTTAAAIAALEATGSFPGNAANYLLNSQDNQTGGFAYQPGQTADGASTAWVMWGLRAAEQQIPQNARDFLESLQLPDGSFKWIPNDSAGSPLVTAYAVIALNNKTLPLNVVTATPPTPDPEPGTPTPEPEPEPEPQPPTPEPAANGASCVSTQAPDSVIPNEQFFAIITLKNTGTKTWTAQNYKLGSQNPQDNTRWGLARVNLPVTQVEPQASVSFTFSATAPSAVDSYTFTWQMVEEFVQWFGQTCSTTIKVVQPQTPTPEPQPPAPAPEPEPEPNPEPETPTPDPQPSPQPEPTPSTQTHTISIRFPDNKIFIGKVSIDPQNVISKTGQNFSSSSPNALQALVIAMDKINLLYEIQDTSYGPFVKSINGYGPSGAQGWLYAVNGQTPSVGANNYNLQQGDTINWFYGGEDTNPY